MSSSSSTPSASDIEATRQQLAQLRTSSPNILFVIARSKNKNIVVYEAIRTADGQLDHKKPVDVYWLDIDPEYVAANRKKGITTDRSDLNMVEKQFAYGIHTEPVASKPGHYHCKLVALPARAVTVYLDAATQTPRATMQINGKQTNLLRVYIHAEDRWVGLPKVIYVDIVGVEEDGTIVHERMHP